MSKTKQKILVAAEFSNFQFQQATSLQEDVFKDHETNLDSVSKCMGQSKSPKLDFGDVGQEYILRSKATLHRYLLFGLRGLQSMLNPVERPCTVRTECTRYVGQYFLLCPFVFLYKLII